MGSQQFDLPVSETYPTNHPAGPDVGAAICATIRITINWNLASTELTGKEVEFDPPRWAVPGCGPLTIYDPASHRSPALGQVSWSIKTHAVKKMETDLPNRRSLWTVTPVVQLIRHVTMTDGSSQSTVAHTVSNTVRGGWTATQ